MERIPKAAALAEIDQYERDGQPHIFSLAYRKVDGSRGEKQRCRKGGAGGGVATGGGGGRFGYKIKEKGVLQLLDCNNNRPFAVKIDLLISYNGVRIQH